MSINHLAFNNLITNLTCCTNQGYTIYSLSPALEKKLSVEFDGGVGIMKMFNKSNIVVLVGGGEKPFKSKDTFVLWDQKNKSSLIEIDMREPVKNVLIFNEKIVAVLEKKICLFKWTGDLLDKKETYSNEKGLCVVNMTSDVIATLGSKKGEIAIWKISNDNYKTIQAHLTNVEALAISHNGKFVATASETGTLIRIFSTETGNKEYEFRRGTQSANIYDLCFNTDATVLACTTSNGTVHVFDIYNDKNTTKNTQSMLSGLQNWLPTYFSSQWAYKQLSINNTTPSVCAFDENNDLHIATVDGNYYKIPGKTKEFNNVTQGNLFVNNK
ncbi:WD40 repeat protein [Fadolivirus algeromassiliense]|jgi:WD40 repeat protein|uniref:WD40 repeat protein n=1 Tax=Fadolivirus FV1/VV64 TaxID=3070911 RepID=A0A7D3UQE0_9VIRU|nr:WD40 repeat protein [Fadolivirus algeromassiliense]QKF94428.1 WD40 repeat protein [Fadolivirus FV1/VV64]